MASYSEMLASALENEFGGDRTRLYNELVEGIASNKPRYDYLDGITAEDIGKFFVDPKLEKARGQFDSLLDRSYSRALQGAGQRLAMQSSRAGIPQTGAVTRMEGTIGKPQGLAASASRARARESFEDKLLSDPNIYAPITNIGREVVSAEQKRQDPFRVLSAILKGGSTVASFVPGGQGIGAGLAAGSGLMDLAMAEEMRKAQERAADFSPQSFMASRRRITNPGGSTGLDYQPFGSNQMALSSMFGQPRRRQDEDQNYLFGGMA